MPIPSVMRFIWINRRDFAEGEYNSILSAIKNLSYDIVLHTDLKPDDIKTQWNPYLLAKKYKKFSIVMREFEEDNILNGVKVHIANISDYHRIQILSELGGLYSDCDILWLKDLPLNLATSRMVGTYDIQSYKHLTTSFMGAVAGHPTLDAMLAEIHTMLADLKAKGKTDISKYCKANYYLLYKIMIRHLGNDSDEILNQREINKNGWRKIGRVLAGNDKLALGDAKGNAICAFNWYNSMYGFEQIKSLKALAPLWATE